MTPKTYLIGWIVGGVAFLLLARWLLIQPIVEAIKDAAK